MAIEPDRSGDHAGLPVSSSSREGRHAVPIPAGGAGGSNRRDDSMIRGGMLLA